MKNEKGFGVIEIILIIVVIVAIGVGGWYVWQANNGRPTTSTLTQDPIQTSDEYKDWETFTFQYEKFSVKYPATFTLEDKSFANENTIPGSDSLRFKKPNGFSLSISTGVDGIGGACEECHVVSSQEITFLGQPAAVNYVANDSTDEVASIVVTKEKDDWFGVGLKGKNIVSAYDGQVLPMSISMSYRNGDNLVSKDLAEMIASEDVKEGLKILESASY